MIRALYIARCGRCGLHPAPMSSPRATLEEVAVAALRETEHDAVALAVQNGWSAYPLLCPDCASKFRATLKEGRDAEVRGDDTLPEGDGTVRQPDESPERPG